MNSRPLKFRAWDDRDKKWLLGYEYQSLGGFSLTGECMLMGEWGAVLEDFFSRSVFEKKDSFQDLKIMQFIGLKDTTGRDVYEGDIVHSIYRTSSGMQSSKYELIEFGEVRSDHPDSDVIIAYGFEIPYYALPDLSNSTVVGNIYETPDLLTKTNA